MSEPTIIATDGCTGFPDQLAGHDFTACCAIHDDGGSDIFATDAALYNCLTDVAPGVGWSVAFYLAVFVVMRSLRPAYNLLQRLGILPKTKGSNF